MRKSLLSHRNPRILIHSHALVDYRGVIASPGALLLEGDSIIDVGTPQAIGTPDGVQFTQIDKVVTPTVVNAHTHLDLSKVGTCPPKNSFTEWVTEVVLPIRSDEEGVEDGVLKGIALSKAGGSVIVGDIAGSLEAAEIVQANMPFARSYVELLGLGQRQQSAIDRIDALPDHVDLSPHALYSCGEQVFHACFQSGRRVSTHLSETLEEIESVRDAHGPLVEHAKKVGSWDESVQPWGEHPIEAFLKVAGQHTCIAAHLNYLDTNHLPLLASSNITVAYCPRASTYFGHTNHRWKEMIDAGINVVLGTDSLLCLDTPDRISVIDEMRLLYSRDGGDPLQLLNMATVHGATALGFDSSLVTLEKGRIAGLLAFENVRDPLSSIFESSTMPTWVCPTESVQNA